MVTASKEVTITTRDPHTEQNRFKRSKAKRKIIRAGRRGGKTVGASICDVEAFLGVCPDCEGFGCPECHNTGKVEPKRVLYTAPTGEQTDAYWYEVTRALRPLVETGSYKQNETERYIEKVGTQNRLKAKTAWNANTLRGDYADRLTFDEWQLTAEDAWDDVGAPMLLDNNGDAIFIYTPPSLKTSGMSRARDPRHATKMFKMAQADTTGRWEAFHFTSFDNPHLNREALSEITLDMSRDSYLKEIMAEDDESQVNLLVYGCFNEAICKVERFNIPKEWMMYVGHDFGSANPAALFAAQNPAGDIFLCNEYAPVVGKSSFQNVEAFRLIVEGYTVLARVGGSHQEDASRSEYTLQGWPIAEPFITGAGSVKAQIDRVKGKMEKNKVYIFSDLYQTLMQINTCMWKLDDMGKPTNEVKDEKKFHLLACLRYLMTLFNPETVRGASKGGMVSAGW
uniref:Putative terminase n=1 Tax=viral metagenome TaxID=1070528 RepID=A0A6M3L6I0_9ZZZZ